MPPFVPRKRRRSSSPLPPPASADAQSSEQKPTLFDTLDARPHGRTLEGNKAFLDSLRTGSSGSEPCSSESEASVAGPSRSRKVEGEDEEEVDWEDAIEYAVPAVQGSEPSGDLELTIEKNGRLPLVDTSSKKKGPSKIERRIRVQTHCMHVQLLLYHNFVRNTWVCDRETQQILVAHLTSGVRKEWERWRAMMGLGSAAQGASKSVEASQLGKGGGESRKVKEKTERQREWGSEAVRVDVGISESRGPDPLLRFLRILVGFWKKRFRICAPGLRKVGYQAPLVLESKITSFRNDPYDPKFHGERVRGIEEFREMARKCEGSRDIGAQLFTALLKGLGLETRLVANLQPTGFGWSKAENAVVTSRAGNDDQSDVNGASGDEHSEGEHRARAKRTDGKAREITEPALKGRKHRGGRGTSAELWDGSTDGSNNDDNAGLVRGGKSPIAAQAPMAFDKDLAFPIYWSEVLSPVTSRYVPVDALVLKIVAATPDTLASFEPRGAKAEKAKQVIPYVVSYSSDGTAKDVTVRYLKRKTWPGKTKGFRIPIEKVPVYDSRGKVKRYDEFDWFKSAMSLYERPINKRTRIDDIEDTDLQPTNPARGVKAGAETLQGYKNSAEFVLERHLHREEAIIPGRVYVKTFVTGKGEKAKEEKVYRRSDVASCKSSESWHKEGREIKEGEQPIKLVPMRAVTLNRKREIEQAEADGGGKVMQGLYSRDQTQWIIPPPIVDGVIPKNAFGNMDCYVPSMVPEGAVHIRLRGTAKVARTLGIDYAEAVVGFDFGAQRAVPVIEGVVVAAENERVIVDAWHEAEEERRRKEYDKREKVALGNWRKFLMGLRIIEHVREEYGGNLGEHLVDEMNPFVNRKKKDNLQRSVKDDLGISTQAAKEIGREGELHGGFFREDTDGIEDAGTSGFIPSSRDEVGFIVEGMPTGGDCPATTDIPKQAPISLFSLHRETSGGILETHGSGEKSDGGAELTPVSEGRSRTMVGTGPGVSSIVKASEGDFPMTPQSMDKGVSRRKNKEASLRRGSTTSGTKPRASRTSQAKRGLSDQSIDSSAFSDLDLETAEDNITLQNTGTQRRIRRELPRRTAARGKGPVRSCYFELSDDDFEWDADCAGESPGRPARKKRRTNPGAVRQSGKTAK
jgi:xeroderma pigmentosum group C-complementing protein